MIFNRLQANPRSNNSFILVWELKSYVKQAKHILTLIKNSTWAIHVTEHFIIQLYLDSIPYRSIY